ncbi:MAG: hypothetical protein ACI9MC_004223, partial [Kiritimatiellia bacterium]
NADKPPRDRPTGGPIALKEAERRVIAESFVPLPGYTALKRHDTKRFAMAMGVTLPVTALWVYSAGRNSSSGLQLGALGLGGFYVTTVAVNQVFGLQTVRSKAQFSVLPTSNGHAGASVAVRLPLR